MKIILHGLLALVCVVCSGCVPADCESYRTSIEKENVRERIESIADTYIFSDSLAMADITSGGLVGPGEWRLRNSTELAHDLEFLRPKEFISKGPSFQIRLLGDKIESPDAIFIGLKSYRGLIVGRGEIEKVIQDLKFRADRDIYYSSGRIAVICYDD